MPPRAESTVLLGVSHSNLKLTTFIEIRLDCHMSIERVKEKLMEQKAAAVKPKNYTQVRVVVFSAPIFFAFGM